MGNVIHNNTGLYNKQYALLNFAVKLLKKAE